MMHLKCAIKSLQKIALRIAFAGCLFSLAFENDVMADTGDTVNIVFTSDMHSHLDSYKVEDALEIKSVGGFARLKTFLDEKRENCPDVIVLDGGDIAMGTLFQTLYTTEALEYRMLGMLGYDATTFGNHDFDYDTDGIVEMLNAASESGDSLPPIACCNIDVDNRNPASSRILEAARNCGLCDYVIIERGGLKIAVTGVFGYDAVECAPTCELEFLDPIESVKATVELIKRNENPDMIVCLSHSEKDADPEESEDRDLAKAVPDIDVIISGHSHRALEEPEIVGDTAIVACGSYDYVVADCTFFRKPNGRYQVNAYELVTLDNRFAENEDILNVLSGYKEEIDENYLSNFGYEHDEVLAHSEFSFEAVQDLYTSHTEMRLGNLLSDAYRYSVNHTPVGEECQVDVAIAPSGTIRGTFTEGEIFVKDAFEAYSLGIGPDGNVGFPMIEFYLTGAELKTVAEVDASLSDIMQSARLYSSGLSFVYNPHRLILNKVSDVWLNPSILEDSRTEIVNDQMYHVVSDMYSGRMLGSISKISKGLIKIDIKDKDGNVISDLNQLIVYNEDGSELKTWDAIARYLSSFSKNSEGMSEIPDYYASVQGRKIVDDTYGISSLLKNPSKYFIVLLVVVIVLIVLIIVIIRVIIAIRSRRRVYGTKSRNRSDKTRQKH